MLLGSSGTFFFGSDTSFFLVEKFFLCPKIVSVNQITSATVFYANKYRLQIWFINQVHHPFKRSSIPSKLFTYSHNCDNRLDLLPPRLPPCPDVLDLNVLSFLPGLHHPAPLHGSQLLRLSLLQGRLPTRPLLPKVCWGTGEALTQKHCWNKLRYVKKKHYFVDPTQFRLELQCVYDQSPDSETHVALKEIQCLWPGPKYGIQSIFGRTVHVLKFQ